MLDCMKLRVGTELQLQEEVYDVQYLQNETMFAVAQNKYVYVLIQLLPCVFVCLFVVDLLCFTGTYTTTRVWKFTV